MQNYAQRIIAGLLVLMGLGGCMSAPQSTFLLENFQQASQQNSSFDLPSRLHLDSVSFFPQELYQCGPAALATVLNSSAVLVEPEELVAQVYVPARQGSLQIEMLAAARRYGRIAYLLPPSLEVLLSELVAGRPVLVMQNLGLERLPQWHYAVAVGYDFSTQEIILRSGVVKNYRTKLKTFERTWQRAEHWAVVLLSPGELAAHADEKAYFEAVSGFAREADEESLHAAYVAGLERWPASSTLGMGLGNLHYAKQRLDEAAQSYSTVLDHSPNYAAAHNNLAQVLLEQGAFQRAQLHAEMAVAIGGAFLESYKKTLATIKLKLAASASN